MDYLSISNLPVFWILASVTVLVSAVQAVLYIREAKKAAKVCNLAPHLPKKAFQIGLVSAVGPALSVFVVMVGLMSAIGGPMAWQRLSIIGAAATELSAATLGAQACGMSGLADPNFDLTVLAVSWFGMALNGAGWLVFTGIATPGLEKLRNKISGGDIRWLNVMSAACAIGIFAYLNANQMIADGPSVNLGGTVACLAGAASMMIIGKLVVPKHPKIAEYSLGIAMIIGITLAIIIAG